MQAQITVTHKGLWDRKTFPNDINLSHFKRIYIWASIFAEPDMLSSWLPHPTAKVKIRALLILV